MSSVEQSPFNRQEQYASGLLDLGLQHAKRAKQLFGSQADFTLAKKYLSQAIQAMSGKENTVIAAKISKLQENVDQAVMQQSSAVTKSWNSTFVHANDAPPIVRPYSDAHPELKAELEELQKHVSERGYAFPLTVDAPIPGSEHPIDQVKARQWIQAHPEVVAQEVAQTLIDQTTYISFEAFETELKRSVASLNDKLRENPTQPFIVVVKEKKSNGWVAALAMRHLERLPDQIVDMEEKNLNQLAGARVVFFDDALYSGSQLSGYIRSFTKTHADVQFTCQVVAPFITTFAEGQLLSLAKDNHIHLEIAEHAHMASINEKLQDHQNILLDTSKMYFTNWDGSVLYNTFHYFSHKIADNLSSVPQVYVEGLVMDSKGGFILGTGRKLLAHPFIQGKVKEPYKQV